MMTFIEMLFNFMPEKGTIVAVFIWRILLENNRARGGKLYMCFVDLDKVFDRVLGNVLEWETRKKGIPVVMVRSVMSACEGAKTRV